MKLLMDADCLIKLTKAGLKDLVGSKFAIFVPEVVKREVVGDEALITLFHKEKYDAVATDDAKLIRRLRISSIPFILPGLVIYQLLQDNMINKKTTNWALKQSAEFISEDEYSAIRLLMERKK